MRFDLHSHTIYSSETKWPFESIIKPADLVKVAIKRGLDGIAITDHDTLRGALDCSKIVKQKNLNLKIIKGLEITTKRGHILGLDIEEWDSFGKDSIEETIDKIRDMGGIAVAAHPFASNRFRKSLGEDLVNLDIDGIEALNFRTSENDNRVALKIAKKLNLGITAGSDAHTISDIGRVWTFSDQDDIIQAIIKRHTKVFGKEMSNFKRYTYQLHKILELSKISSL